MLLAGQVKGIQAAARLRHRSTSQFKTYITTSLSKASSYLAPRDLLM